MAPSELPSYATIFDGIRPVGDLSAIIFTHWTFKPRPLGSDCRFSQSPSGLYTVLHLRCRCWQLQLLYKLKVDLNERKRLHVGGSHARRSLSPATVCFNADTLSEDKGKRLLLRPPALVSWPPIGRNPADTETTRVGKKLLLLPDPLSPWKQCCLPETHKQSGQR